MWFVVLQLQGEDTGDFEATTAAAFLLSSESRKTIFIAVKDDDLPEADETFVFELRLQVNLCGCVLVVSTVIENKIIFQHSTPELFVKLSINECLKRIILNQ